MQGVRARLATEQAILFQLQQFYKQHFDADQTLQDFMQLQDRLTGLSYEVSGDARLAETLAKTNNILLGEFTNTAIHKMFTQYGHQITSLKPETFAATLFQTKSDSVLQVPTNIIPLSQPKLQNQTNFTEVLEDSFKPEIYKNKLVLLGETTGVPDDKILQTANILNSLLHQQFLQRHQSIHYIELSLFMFSLVYLLLLSLRLKLNMVMLWLGGLWGIYIACLYIGQSLHIIPSTLLVVSAYLIFNLKQLIETYQDAVRLHPNAVESNRLLGLAFQGQGHLDLAFEKFRLCPPDEAILGLLYNLALDYELKQQTRRAVAVYRYILTHQITFRDVQKRLDQLQRMNLPKLPLHGLSQSALNNSTHKPHIGRYQIERQLGKGAMGVVYLGRDIKLDRMVAIKTLPLLGQEFDIDPISEAVVRFFREANAAGRLQHNDIIQIYDAGGEQDVAYIAMEFFKGGNLIPYARKENLLSINVILNIVSRIALALDYAHQHQVIHRDIKPANIMYNPATNQIKITDFGIARIADTHKTKTGIILGTPSYMSPEQLAGKQIDGRTDLFSLGIMLYQLLTGKLPFQADSMASLMFKIANESHPDITQIRADIPIHLKQIIDTALEKNPRARFQTGRQFAQVLRDCSDEAEYAPRNELSF